MRKKVALFFGGRSLESDISVITAMQVLANADRTLYLVEPVYMQGGEFFVKGVDKLDAFTAFNPVEHGKVILHKGELYLVKRNTLVKYFKPDVALVCCHGGEGENGTLQAMLEYSGIPYTCPSMASSVCGMDKTISKRLFDAMLLNVLPYEVVMREELEKEKDESIARIESLLEYPMIVKPSCQGSSIGIGVAKNREELEFALSVAAKFDGKIIIEHKLMEFIEVNCAAYRDGDRVVVSDTEQPLTASDFLTFDDKYISGGKMSGGGHIIPAEIGALEPIVKANTERIYRELDLNGVVRVDYLVDKNRNKVYVNEVNTVPGSLAFYLFERQGISFCDLISFVIENASIYQKSKKSQTVYKTDVLSRFKGGAKSQKA